MSRFDPALTIKKFFLTDNRPGQERIPGAMLRIVNTFPNITGSERVRPGYSAYASTDGGSTPGQDMPAGFEILKTAGIQNPEQADVHIKFANSGGQKVFMQPWYVGATRQSTDLQVNETQGAFGPIAGGDYSITPANTLNITNVGTYLPTAKCRVDGYYTGWVFFDSTLNKYAQIKTYSYSGFGDVGTFVFVEDIDGTGFNFVRTDSFQIFRNFHNNLSFSPAYNTDLPNAPTLNVENSIIRFSGGQGSTNGLRGIWVNPRLTRTLFAGLSARSLSFDRTYISERELKSADIKNGAFSWSSGDLLSDVGKSMTPNTTLWVGVAPVYDGFQLGVLSKYETVSDYPSVSGAYYSTTNNQIVTSQNTVTPRGTHLTGLNITLATSVATLSKRITGFAVYVAVDEANVSKRLAAYRLVKFISIVDSSNTDGWAFGTSGSLTEVFYLTLNITQAMLSSAGNTYEEDSGIVESPTDTMYAYSTEEIVGTRRFIANAYVNSETFTDRQNVFTNPLGGNSVIGNVGQIQPDLFSNEQPIYRLRVDPTVGTKINGIARTGINELLVLKDRGCVLARVIDIDGLPDLNLEVISHEAGSATLNAWDRDDNDFIWFASYQDIYRYKQGDLQPTIQKADSNDWLNTYRNTIASVDKENAAVVYVPGFKAVIFMFGNQHSTYEQLQYIFLEDYGWRELRLNESNRVPQSSFKFWCKLQSGHTLGVTATSAAVKRLFWKYSSGLAAYILTFSDDGTAIAPLFDTGDFIVGDGRDIRLNKFHILRVLDSATQGQLDCEVYLDGSLVRSYLNLDKSVSQLIVNSLSDDPRLGYTVRFRYNVNATNPERLNAGSQLQFESVLIYGDTLPHFRVSENSGGLTKGILVLTGTINGVREVTITTAGVAQTFTFDVPFTETYPGSLGTEPSYRFDIDSAHRVSGGVEDTTSEIVVDIVSRTLTQITLRAAEDNTIVRYSIS